MPLDIDSFFFSFSRGGGVIFFDHVRRSRARHGDTTIDQFVEASSL